MLAHVYFSYCYKMIIMIIWTDVDHIVGMSPNCHPSCTSSFHFQIFLPFNFQKQIACLCVLFHIGIKNDNLYTDVDHIVGMSPSRHPSSTFCPPAPPLFPRPDIFMLSDHISSPLTSHISYLTACLSHGTRVFLEEDSGGRGESVLQR